MNKILIIFCSAALLTAACDDFLDEAPRGYTIPNMTEDYNKLLNDGTMNNMLFFDAYYPAWKSDELIYTDGSLATVSQLSSFPTSIEAAAKLQADIYRADQTSTEWNTCYNQIYTLNVIVGEVMNSNGNEVEKQYLLAEARVHRAYMHWLLAQWYSMPYDENLVGQELTIPIVTEANTQVMNYDRATMQELYAWITAEMEDACPQLEKREEHRMRCYKATGYALMGKVYFSMNRYDDALRALRVAYDLLRDDPNVYLTDHNEKQASYGYRELTMNEMLAYMPYAYRDNEALFCKYSNCMKEYYPTYYGAEPAEYLSPKVYALYDEHDLRRNLIITKDASGNSLSYPTATFYTSQVNVGCKLPEVYLMLAECEARVGSVEEAREILTELRRTRVLPGYEEVPQSVVTREDLVRYCFDEETREFAGSDYRYYMVRRLWNDPLFQAQKPLTHEVSGQIFTWMEEGLKTELPETVLNWNESWR